MAAVSAMAGASTSVTLHQKSGSLSPFKRFAFELRDIIRRQPLPGYTLFLETEIGGRALLLLSRCPPVDNLWTASCYPGTRTIVLSGTGGSCYQEPKQGVGTETPHEIAPLT